MGYEKGDVPVPENETAEPENVVKIKQGLAPGQVRGGGFKMTVEIARLSVDNIFNGLHI